MILHFKFTVYKAMTDFQKNSESVIILEALIFSQLLSNKPQDI